MANSICFCGLFGKQKKDKGRKKYSETTNNDNGLKLVHIQLEGAVKSSETDEERSTSFSLQVPFGIPRSSRCRVKVMNHESPVGGEVEEIAYEGEDEHDENLSMKRDNSDLDLQAHVANSNEENQPIGEDRDLYDRFDIDLNDQCERKSADDADEDMETAKCGHLSDPGPATAEFWASPKLLRSCSDVGMRDMVMKIRDELPPTKSPFFEEMQESAERFNKEVLPMNVGSPLSVKTQYSADKVILKKHSSSQILPSRSRKLWWKLFLWSHRNLQGTGISKPPPIRTKPALNQQGGYSSDTLEATRVIESSKMGLPNSFTGESFKNGNFDNDNQSWDGFHATSGLWPQNQWVALPAESPTMTRVDEWVKRLSVETSFQDEKIDNNEDLSFPPSSGVGGSPARSSSHLNRHPTMNIPEDIAHANSVIQSLNSSSTVAHIMGIGLKVVPFLSCLSSLRSVNLSGNFIVHVTPGSLPKGLHTLNLSRNRISTIEGLRELTRLRVLDLSYNRISRIGQGLSNCTLIKELYLAGNKISDVEGLHRLLKLTILDLSFNKITTTKALGQLVANYNSLMALNLLGNPIQSNINDDQLRKTLCSLLSKLAFLNKQPVNPQKAREAGREAIAKAALGNSSRSTRRKSVRKVSQGSTSSSSLHRGSASVGHKNRDKTKSRAQYHSSAKTKPSNLASSSR